VELIYGWTKIRCFKSGAAKINGAKNAEATVQLESLEQKAKIGEEKQITIC
jgi:hypothetical protein